MSLTKTSLDTLLAAFDLDRERAGQQYEYIRLKLIKFFQYHHCYGAEDHADEVLNRVARRLAKGEKILDLKNYIYGVARFLVKEIQRKRDKDQDVFAELFYLSQRPSPPGDVNLRTECFEECLGKLPVEELRLLIRYYEDDKNVKIQNRKRLAEAMGIQLRLLRLKAHRIRERLKICINDCLTIRSGVK